jgi:hypothetical protein
MDILGIKPCSDAEFSSGVRISNWTIATKGAARDEAAPFRTAIRLSGWDFEKTC